MGRTGFGGRVAVAAAAALLTLCLAGAPLYVSSSATAALAERLERVCPANAGLQMYIGLDDERVSTFLDERVPQVRHLLRRIDTSDSFRVEFSRVDNDDGLGRNMILLHRTGQEDHVDGPVASLRPGEVLMPQYLVEAMGLEVGEQLKLRQRQVNLVLPGQQFEPNPEFREKNMTIAGTYTPVPVQPLEDFWCGIAPRFLPTARGDAPPAVGFVSSPEEAMLASFALQSVELWVDPDGLSRHEARETADDIDALVDDLAALLNTEPEALRTNSEARTGLPGLVEYAESLSNLVRRTVQPVRIAGVLAGIGLLAASSVLLAREQRRELRLRQLRGEALRVTFGHNLSRAGGSAVIGSVLGLVGAVLAVRALGPSSLLEPDPLREAVLWSVVGAISATAIVAVGVTVVSARLVDPRPVQRRWVRLVPWELLVVAVAIAAYMRLDRAGGIRLVGSEARGGDALGLAFPVVAILAPVVVLARPATALIRRLRFTGGRLWFPLRLGWRRVAHEAWTSTVLGGAVAVAAGTFLLADTLSASSEAMLQDKAAVYLGTDLVLTVQPGSDVPDAFPADLAGRATVVRRAQATITGIPVDVIGIDSATFTDGARWRGDLAGSSLDDLVASLSVAGADGRWPVIVGGFDATPPVPFDVEIETRSRKIVPAQVRGAARWLPSAQTGTGQVLVLDDLFDSMELPASTFVWVRDPPDDALAQLEAAGFQLRGARAPQDVFEVTSFLAVSWSYDAFAGLGLLVALVTLVAEVVVLQARRSSRQTSWVITRPMGVGARQHAIAIFVEIAIPVVVGALVGSVAAVVAARASVRRLDALRHLDPPALARVDTSTLATAGIVMLVALVVLAAIGTVSTLRVRKMEVMRGTA